MKTKNTLKDSGQDKAQGDEKDDGKWVLRLYVAGQTPKSIAAFENLKTICDEQLAQNYVIEVIDLIANPKLSRDDQILAIPTLVRKLPEPVRKIIGDLSNKEKVLVGLNLIPRRLENDKKIL